MAKVNNPQWEQLGKVFYEMRNIQMEYFRLSKEFHESENAVEVLNSELKYGDSHLALRLCQTADVTILQELFNELIYYYVYSHRYAGLAYDAIMQIPKEWLLEHVEEATEPCLANGDETEYCMVAGLYKDIDTGLFRRIVQRALASENFNLRELGQDLLETLPDEG